MESTLIKKTVNKIKRLNLDKQLTEDMINSIKTLPIDQVYFMSKYINKFCEYIEHTKTEL